MSHYILFGRFLSLDRILEGGSDAKVRQLRIPMRATDVTAVRRRTKRSPARRRRKTRGNIVLQERR